MLHKEVKISAHCLVPSLKPSVCEPIAINQYSSGSEGQDPMWLAREQLEAFALAGEKWRACVVNQRVVESSFRLPERSRELMVLIRE